MTQQAARLHRCLILAPDQVKGWMMKLALLRKQNFDFIKYNPREKSLFREKNPTHREATGQASMLPWRSEAVRHTLYCPREPGRPTMDWVSLAVCRLSLRHAGSVGILQTFRGSHKILSIAIRPLSCDTQTSPQIPGTVQVWLCEVLAVRSCQDGNHLEGQ